MLKDTSVVNTKLDTLNKTSQSENPICDKKLGLPLELCYRDNDNNELHHLADARLLKIVESRLSESLQPSHYDSDHVAPSNESPSLSLPSIESPSLSQITPTEIPYPTIEPQPDPPSPPNVEP